jgi:hypothetical protein
MQRHRHQEFIRFLNAVEAEVRGPPMARPPSAVYIPLHANLMLMAERRRGVFATLTKRRLKRGVFHWIFDLQASINRFLKEHNMQAETLRLDRRSR